MAAAVGMTMLGAVLNATAFTGGSILGQKLSGQGGELVQERERHDRALEKFNDDTEAYREKQQQIYDWKKKREGKEYKADRDLAATDEDIELYNIEWNSYKGEVGEQPAPASKPVLSDYYTPSEEQKKWELIYIGGGLVVGGLVVFKLF